MAKKRKLTRKPVAGVEYNRVAGVVCPSCRMFPGGSVTNTLPWEDGVRVRYHTCRRCGTRFKSVEDC